MYYNVIYQYIYIPIPQWCLVCLSQPSVWHRLAVEASFPGALIQAVNHQFAYDGIVATPH